LQAQFRDSQVVSMVLLAAYGNFQDRILLGLNLPMDADGPLAPLDVEFVEGALQMASLMPPQRELPPLQTAGKDLISNDGDWAAVSFDELQSRLESQRKASGVSLL